MAGQLKGEKVFRGIAVSAGVCRGKIVVLRRTRHAIARRDLPETEVAAELIADAKNYLVENASVTVTFVEDKAVTVELPSSVVLTVTDAPEGIRGDSANNVQKAILVETGITVQAPLFIKTGEKIKVDTRTGKYMERA